jgi:Flp pilus assembly protein TadG
MILRALERLHNNRRAQATVELLILTPLVIFLFLIVIDFSLALREAVMVNNAVREGARYGALGGSITPAQITDRVVDSADGAVQAGEVEVGYPNGTDRGDSVVVRAEHDYTFKFLSNIFAISPTLTLTSCADMRLETTASGGGSGVTC